MAESAAMTTGAPESFHKWPLLKIKTYGEGREIQKVPPPHVIHHVRFD
jgi:hypothetical protein